MELNARQRTAVEAGDGPVLIMAGPGTGKTKTLTARMAYLLEQGVSASRILALTFTVKAAAEMRERLATLVDATALPTIATFHSLGYKLLREAQPEVQYDFITDGDRLAVIRDIPRPQELKSLTARELSLAISRYKGEAAPVKDGALARLTAAYQKVLAERRLLDFDDLLYRAQEELASQPELRALWRGRYDYILIDEFQDTSELQWRLIQLIRGNDAVFVIGDPKQSIYGFRGASAAMFEQFRRNFPTCVAVTLDINYRSDQAIVRLAGAVFGGPDSLTAQSDQPGEVQAVCTLNEFSEADYVLSRIEEGIGGSDLLKAQAESKGRRLRDFAVLYRTHQAARIVQKRLHESGIPMQVVGEGSPYEEADVQALIGLLGWFVGRGVPLVKGFTPRQVAALLERIDGAQPVSQLATQLIASFGFDSDKSRARLQQFVGGLVRFGSDLAACLRYTDELATTDFYDSATDAVTLMTIHASKGLEFAHVLLIAAEEDILPAIRKTKPTDFDEEKRLFYVAATRAKQQLDIIYAQKRGGETRVASRFIRDVPADILPRREDPALPELQKKLHRRQQKARQATLF